MRVINAALFVALFLLLSDRSGPVQAYLDPGTGSMVIQVVLGGIVGGLTLLRLYWRRVKALFSRRQQDDNVPFGD